MQKISKREVVRFDDSPTDDKTWLFYVAVPYSYNPVEAYKYAIFYRNSLVNQGIYSYNPICETHTPHVDYMELMTKNLDSDEELKSFKESLYKFYVDEDLLKARMLDKGSDHKYKFAMLMGVGWNLKFPIHHENHMDPGPKHLKQLYDKYRSFIDVQVDPISKGCLHEYFWGIQNGIPVYDLGLFLSELKLVQCRLDIVEDQKEFWKYASLLGLKTDG
jgi:hypothetical protein